jgi:virginiamycin B lyase
MNRLRQSRVSWRQAPGFLLLLVLLAGGPWGSAGAQNVDLGAEGLAPQNGTIDIAPVASFSAGAYPSALLYGPQDSFWFNLLKGNAIASFTPPSTVSSESVPTAASEPYDLTIGPDKKLWFSEQKGNQIGRYDLQGAFDEFPLPRAGVYPSQVALGQDGGVWFSELEGNRIGRIAQDGEMVEYPLPNSNSRPLGVAVDLEGNIWFSEWSGCRIGKLTPQGDLSEYEITDPPLKPSEIILGPDGNLWVIFNSGRRIVRVDPGSGGMTAYTLPTVSSSLLDLAIGPDGAIWFLGVQSMGHFDATLSGPANLVETGLPPFDFQGQGRSQLIAGPDEYMYFTRMDEQEVYTATVGTADLRDLQVFINHLPRYLLAAGEFKLAAEVQNWSENPATDVQIDLALDSFIEYVDIDAPGATCGEAGGHVVCDLPSLAGGDSFPFTYTLQTTRVGGGEEQWFLSLEASSSEGDYLPANNRQIRFMDVLTAFRYFNDFSLGADEYWSEDTTSNPFGGLIYLGPFDNDRVILTFEDLPPHDRAWICFDLYVLGPWDGSHVVDPEGGGNPPEVIGPDLWSFYLDEERLLVTSFSNRDDLTQAYPGFYPQEENPAQASANAIGNFGPVAGSSDARYHLCYVREHTADQLAATFYGLNLNVLEAEGWALDNVEVKIYNNAVFDWLYLPVVVR